LLHPLRRIRRHTRNSPGNALLVGDAFGLALLPCQALKLGTAVIYVIVTLG
jgi:hypothetical protein